MVPTAPFVSRCSCTERPTAGTAGPGGDGGSSTGTMLEENPQRTVGSSALAVRSRSWAYHAPPLARLVTRPTARPFSENIIMSFRDAAVSWPGAVRMLTGRPTASSAAEPLSATHASEPETMLCGGAAAVVTQQEMPSGAAVDEGACCSCRKASAAARRRWLGGGFALKSSPAIRARIAR